MKGSHSLTIFIVEDNDDLRETLCDALATQGHQVRGVDCAEAVPEQAGGPIDLMIIDLNLPGEDGISLASRLRQAQPELGIIMLTARQQAEDRTTGYASGADIYLTKPTSMGELNGAIQALARRLKPLPCAVATLHLDSSRLELSGTGERVTLTPSEAAVLAAFGRASAQRLEHWQLIECLGKPDASYSKAALEMLIGRLRKKLQQAGAAPSAIKSLRGIGYQLCCSICLE